MNLSTYFGCIPKVFLIFLEYRGSFWEMLHKSSCSAKWWDEMSIFCTWGKKHESVTCKFTKNSTPSQVFFKEFDQKLGTATLKNTSWWLLLRTITFSEHSWIAVSQSQYTFNLKVLTATYISDFLSWHHVKEERIFIDFILVCVTAKKICSKTF